MKLRCHLDAHVGDTGQSLLSHLLNGSHSEPIGTATNPERLDKLTLRVRKREARKADEKCIKCSGIDGSGVGKGEVQCNNLV